MISHDTCFSDISQVVGTYDVLHSQNKFSYILDGSIQFEHHLNVFCVLVAHSFSQVPLIYMDFFKVLHFPAVLSCFVVCFKRILKCVTCLILLLSIKLLLLALVGVAANELGNKTKHKIPVCMVLL